jgi:NurA domain
MAIDFQNISDQIKAIGASAQERKKTLDERRAQARELLNGNADNLPGLRYKVETAKAADPSIRCALPLVERLDFHTPAPDLPSRATLIAADGSQILPDRHSALQYGLINVGAIILRLNSGQAPVIRTDSRLLFDDKLFTSSGGPLTESMLALQRDTEERTKLLNLADEFGAYGDPVITFTDGPLELWGVRDGEEANLVDESLRKYLSVLSRLQERGIITAGYIDKPSSDPLARLLELAQAGPENLQKLREYHPLRGVTDRWLFGEVGSALLAPGERSAVFGFQSRAEKDYKGLLALHFFYLNISVDERKPQIARVDIPKWVLDEPGKLDLLHAVLIQQCRIMGAKPYPYLLHRAHESAVVSFDEKRQVDQMLMLELQRSGAEIGDISNKQSAKELPGRTSF